MEIKIDKDGFLEIKRAGKFKLQYCPHMDFGDGEGTAPCSDSCPLFGEPDTYKDEDGKMDMLKICNGRYLTGKITDERGVNDPGLDEIAARKAASDRAYAEACAR